MISDKEAGALEEEVGVATVDVSCARTVKLPLGERARQSHRLLQDAGPGPDSSEARTLRGGARGDL